MNNSELDRLIKEKIQRYVPARPIQVMHGGVIVLVSIAIGIFTLPTGQEGAATATQGLGAWLGVYLAISGVALYVLWTYLRIAKARKEATEEYLAASSKKSQEK